MDILNKHRFSLIQLVMVISWTISIFSYFFQFPFSGLSIFIVPGLAVYLIGMICYKRRLYINRDWYTWYAVYICYLLTMVIVSLFSGVEVARIIRFLLILSVTPLFSVVKAENFRIEYIIFVVLAFLKSILLLWFAIHMIYSGNPLEFREWAAINNYGDIYTNPYTHMPKVQVQGNGILPMAFIINVTYGRKKILTNVINFVLLLGVISAGNAAFVLAIILFCAYRLYNNVTKRGNSLSCRFVSLLALVFGSILFIVYAIYILELKSGFSNAIRIEQAKILLDNNIIVGNGLGYEIYYSGMWRNYAANNYFELQTLYIFNQIGLVGICLFYLLVIIPIKNIGKNEFVLFLIYLIYTFWNPYCFDTTEMIVITLLVNCSEFLKKDCEIGKKIMTRRMYNYG